MARTAWLTVFCLLGLGPFVLVKAFSGTSTPSIAADVVDAPLALQSSQGDTLAKADRLPVFRQPEAEQAAKLSMAAVAPAVALTPPDDVQAPVAEEPKIVARHWHAGDPIPKGKRNSERRLSPKRNKVASSLQTNGR
jgi:hypothetical protein